MQRAALAILAAAALLQGCAEPPAPGPAWPSGAFVVARTAALEQLTAQLATLEGTPIGRRAAAIGAALPDCDVVAAHAPDGDVEAMFADVHCPRHEDALARTWREEGEPDAVFAIPLAAESHTATRLRGTLQRGPEGSAEIAVSLPRDAFDDARALLLPGDEPPGEPVLSTRDTLLHARVRPDGGIDVASMVPAGSQADQLFGLKSALFAGVVLDGTWELGVYLPQPGSSMLRAALGLGIGQRAAALVAVEELLAVLEERWPLRRAPFAIDGAEGGCLFELKLMPELAPCWVTGERALVVGWNAASVRAALAGDGPAAFPAEAGLVVELERFAEADAHLAATGPDAAETSGPRLTYPWRRLVARGARNGDSIELRVVLEGGNGA